MSYILYTPAKRKILDGTIKLYSDTLKMMLLTSPYTPGAKDDLLDMAGTNDAHAAETVATNYTGGFGGSGRKTLTTVAFSIDATNHKAYWSCDPITWSTLGGVTNETIVAGVVIKEVTDDAHSLPILYADIADFLTNGSDLTLTPDSTGIFRW